MCLAVPGKVISIDESNPELRMAKVNFGGVNKNICCMAAPRFWAPFLHTSARPALTGSIVRSGVAGGYYKYTVRITKNTKKQTRLL